jgi:phospholipid transport system substrate-binding protein
VSPSAAASVMSRFIRLASAAALALAGACLLPAYAQSPAEIQAPDALVKAVTLEVVEIIRNDKEIQAGDRRKVVAVIESKVLPHFNFASMTASAVGRNWEKASAEQKARLTTEFRTLLVRTYASSLAAYSNQKLEFRPLRAKPTDTDVTVNVRVLQPGSEAVQIDYDMEKRPTGWKVWDVRVGGISLVANYRTEFDNLVREAGVEGLIQSLAKKNQSLSRGAVAGMEKK